MPEWSKFTDDEINSIKIKLNEAFDKGMKIILLFTPIICLIMPYMPGRRGRGRMIDSMEYEEAVLQFGIIWLLTLLGVSIWNNYKTNKQFSDNRIFFRKKSETTIIKLKSKSAFSRFDDLIITELKGKLKSIKIDKDQSKKFEISDQIKIEYEEQTSTILKLEKVSQIN